MSTDLFGVHDLTGTFAYSLQFLGRLEQIAERHLEGDVGPVDLEVAEQVEAALGRLEGYWHSFEEREIAHEDVMSCLGGVSAVGGLN